MRGRRCRAHRRATRTSRYRPERFLDAFFDTFFATLAFFAAFFGAAFFFAAFFATFALALLTVAPAGCAGRASGALPGAFFTLICAVMVAPLALIDVTATPVTALA